MLREIAGRDALCVADLEIDDVIAKPLAPSRFRRSVRIARAAPHRDRESNPATHYRSPVSPHTHEFLIGSPNPLRADSNRANSHMQQFAAFCALRRSKIRQPDL